MSTDKPTTTPPEPEKPRLVLMHGDQITFESLMTMFERLTGRKPTDAEVEEAKAEFGEE